MKILGCRRPEKKYKCNSDCDNCSFHGVIDVVSEEVKLPTLSEEQKKLLRKCGSALSPDQNQEINLRL
jgi:hypothetical protein